MKAASEFIDRLIQDKLKVLPPGRSFTGAGHKDAPHTGTVVIAYPYNRGILFGADRQVTWGMSKIFRSNFQKIQKVTDFSGVAFCGTVSMCQFIADIYQELMLKLEMRTSGELPLKNQVNIFHRLMRMVAFANDGDAGAAFLFAGLDRKNRQGVLLEFQSGGSLYHPESVYLVSGSGYLEANGILKDFWKKIKSPKEVQEKDAIALALRAITGSAESDVAVGHPELQSSTIALIDAEKGMRFVEQDEILAAIRKGGRK